MQRTYVFNLILQRACW